MSLTVKLHRWAVDRLVITALLLLLGACASNPYIGNTRPDPLPNGGATPDERLRIALAYADRTYDAYAAKLPEEYLRQQAVSASLIALGAATLGLAAFGAHSDAVAGAALAGGYIYALGSWNTSQGRPGIYVEGMKAVSCAKLAISPLRIGADQLAIIRQRAQATADAAAKASRSAGEVTRWLSIAASRDPAGQPSSLVTAAGAELGALSDTLDKANEMLGRAAGLEQRVGGAGALLETHIDEIRRLVDSALTGTLSALSALPKVIGSLSDYANIFAPGLNLSTRMASKVDAGKAAKSGDVEVTAESGAPATKAVDPVAQLAFSLGKLRADALILARSASELSGAVEPTTLDQVKVAMASCSVDVGKASTALRLDRTSVSFVAGTAGMAQIWVSGGTQPYTANLVDVPAKGINVPAPAGNAVMIVADSSTEAGRSYGIRVGDSAGAMSSVTVNVVSKTQAGGTGGVSGNSRSSRTTTDGVSSQMSCTGAKRAPEEICLVQQVVSVKITGKMDSATCDAFKSHELTKSFNGMVNNESMEAIRTRANLPATATPSQILGRLAELGVSSCPGAKAKPTSASSLVAGACSAPPTNKQCLSGARCDFECDLSAQQIRNVGRRLRMSQPPDQFTVELREVLLQFQKERKLKNQDGRFDAETAAAVEALPLQ